MMVCIYFNNEIHHAEPAQSLYDLLMNKHYDDDGFFAVAINNQLIPRSNYKKNMLDNGDCVDIIIPMQGG